MCAARHHLVPRVGGLVHEQSPRRTLGNGARLKQERPGHGGNAARGVVIDSLVRLELLGVHLGDDQRHLSRGRGRAREARQAGQTLGNEAGGVAEVLL